MQGFLSRDGIPPADFLAAGRAEIEGYGVEVLEDRVRGFEFGIEPGFFVRLAGGQALTARRILLATGVGDELPDIPGGRERWGRDLLHCPYCHGWEVRDQPVGVLGSHPGAVQHAQLVRQWSADVVFFVHTHADGLAASLGCELDEAGFVTVDTTGRTSTPGVWAAGNVVDPRAQVITSAGAGSAAAIAINADLVQDDVARAVNEPGRLALGVEPTGSPASAS